MTQEMGLWIDHRRAVIVTDFEGDGAVQQIASKMEKRVRYAVSSPSAGAKPHQKSSEDGRDRRFNENLDRFYDEVITHLKDATAILVMGPGEAKTELQKRLSTRGISDEIVSVMPADKMTDPEIVAEVNKHFQASRKGLENPI